MAHRTNFTQLAEKVDFVKEEERILKYWESIKAFEKQLELTKDKPRFTFYDGPPFATGLPHYGHICAGTIKDVVCRYWAQNDRYVERRFGWDCHGLPVEFEIDKKLKITHRNQVLELGVDKYNAECRAIVQLYANEWRRIVGRTGRWIDFDNDYKTLDVGFMESVWWVFKQMWDKGLVYRGSKVMPYSNGCSTVLSNFETQQNYKEVWDPAIVVTFPLVDDPETLFVAWTTTPWTLPSNLALAINPTFIYVKVHDKEKNQKYILAKSRLIELYENQEKYEILEEILGEKLVGKSYVSLFPYYEERRAQGCFRVLGADFVTNDSGTGIVHCAPGFGDDDYKVCLKNGLIDPADPGVPIDPSGKFLPKIQEFEGLYVKDADKVIRKVLTNNGRLIKDGQTKHNYPFCWRSETPLIYKAVSSWFVKVTAIKEQLVANNLKSRWVPQSIQEGRFNNWLENAQDWCISRNRFWGNPIPIWVSDDYEEQVCIGSIEELRQLSGVQDINDLHKEFIDKITIPSKQGKGVLRRIDEIFDCWFESGSMPFAQQHYPFERQDIFEDIFPADFIAEGIDQTRGWFYTLNVVSTAVRNETPYKNLIVNGLCLNAEGKKMSKSKRNYPDPETQIINVYGADPMRLYLINSGLVKAENLNFKEAGVEETVKNVFLPWYNAYKFLIQNIQRYELDTGKQFVYNEIKQIQENPMDRWGISTLQNLIQFVRTEMENYRLYTITPKLINFLDQFTNWYLRLNRLRFKGDFGVEDWYNSLNVLFDITFKITILMSPYVPFITESIYQNLRKCIPGSPESVHFINIPQFNQELVSPQTEKTVQLVQNVIEQARILREKAKLSMKRPVLSVTVVSFEQETLDAILQLKQYIQDEVNTIEVKISKDVQDYLQLKVDPIFSVLGAEQKEKNCKDLHNKIKALTQEQIQELQTKGSIKLNIVMQVEKKVQQQEEVEVQEEKQDPKGKKKGKKNAPKIYDDVPAECELLARQVKITETFNSDKLKDQLYSKEEGYLLVIDTVLNEDIKNKWLAREFTNRIQQLRKKLLLQQEDKVFIFYKFQKESHVSKAVEIEFQSIQNSVKKPIFELKWHNKYLQSIGEGQENVDGEALTLYITKEGVVFNEEKLKEKYNEKEVKFIQEVVFRQANLKETFEFSLDGKLIVLTQEEYRVPK